MRSSRSSAISPSEESASRTDSARLSPIQSRLEFLETLKKGRTRYVAACADGSKKHALNKAHKIQSTMLFYRASRFTARHFRHYRATGHAGRKGGSAWTAALSRARGRGPRNTNETSVGSVRCFVEYDTLVCAADADFFHVHAIQTYSGPLKFLTVGFNRHWHFGHGFALLDHRGLVLQFQFVVAFLQFRPVNHDGLVERN